MRLFDDDKIGCYLDDIGHRVEKTKDGKEIKVVDLTLRVQPFTPAVAEALDPDVRSLLFGLGDGEPKPKIKAVEFRLPIPRQVVDVFVLPEGDVPPGIRFIDVEISGPRARTEKGVDGYGFVFYASFGPVSARELEFVCAWHTQQRFLTFQAQMPSLLDDIAADPTPARGPRRVNADAATQQGTP
jgi:hypothetical protein